MDRPPAKRLLADISLGQIVRGLARYKPVGLVVLGILIVALAMPAPGGPEQEGSTLAQGVGRGDGVGRGSPSSGSVGTSPPPQSTATPRTPSTPAPAPDAAPAPDPTPAPTGSTFGPAPDTGFGDDDGEEDAPTGPLRISGSGWASQGAGTPLATADVPEGTLPVGKRVDQLDKASFVRLDGSGFELVLTEHPDGSRGVEEPSVQVCEITESGWPEEEAMSFDEAPEWDPEVCAPGTRDDEGRWTFSLVVFAPASEGPGLALVPGPEAPVDFQVAFEIS